MRDHFQGVDRDALAQLCCDLEKAIDDFGVRPGSFHSDIIAVVNVLRKNGHDLWSIDESDEVEVWGPNYQNPTGAGLVITFTIEGGTKAEWAKQ